MRCPECKEKLEMEFLSCPQGHQFKKENDIYVLLSSSFSPKLHEFLEKFEKVRSEQERKILDKSAYSRLPYFDESFPENLKPKWKIRQQNLELIKPFVEEKQPLKLLNFGAWNGWLSNKLTDYGHEVMAVSYFKDEWDGLGAMRHYSNQWTSVLMNLEDVSILDQKFDGIIFNQGLEFTQDYKQTLTDLISLLNKDGFLIVTGLFFYRIPLVKEIRHKRKLRKFKDTHGFDLTIHPSRGLLDFKDKKVLEKLGFQCIKNPFKKQENRKAKILPIFPALCYGIYHANQ